VLASGELRGMDPDPHRGGEASLDPVEVVVDG
jgi:hypothetical protein